VTGLGRPEVVVHARATVGEGPVWDPRTGRLCWVDIVEGVLFESDLDSGEQSESAMSTMLGAAVPRACRDGFAVAVSDGFGMFTENGLRLVDPVLPEPSRRMNDAKCDSHGRLWAGSTRLDFTPGGGALHRWEEGESSTVVESGFTLPNGMGWSPDDATMYLIDSVEHTVLAADYRAEDGWVGAFHPAFQVDGGLPDGMCVDLDGGLWIAIWGGSEVRRYSPRGELLARVPMPVEKPSSCCFGDDGTLYITSASAGIPQPELAAQPLAGSVFAVSTSARGVSVRSFGG
jgi:sugar lactone lactonase YvrE